MTMNRLLTTLLWLMLLVTVSGRTVRAQVTEQDSLALVALYKATTGAFWQDNTNWLTGPVSTWLGVTVTVDRVTSVSLSHNQLTGGIPPELGNLTNLTRLFLNHNQLTGAIPVELGNLTNLTDLNLQRNQLTGAIPAELGNLTNLTDLDLQRNQLTGMLPQSLINLSKLMTFFFDDTNLCESLDNAFQAWLQGISSLRRTRLHKRRQRVA